MKNPIQFSQFAAILLFCIISKIFVTLLQSPKVYSELLQSSEVAARHLITLLIWFGMFFSLKHLVCFIYASLWIWCKKKQFWEAAAKPKCCYMVLQYIDWVRMMLLEVFLWKDISKCLQKSLFVDLVQILHFWHVAAKQWSCCRLRKYCK